MSVVIAPDSPLTPSPAPGRGNRRRRMLYYVLASFLLLSLIRELTGANDILSAGTLRAALISMIPIALAGLGGLWSERAGVVNIGLEGMMIAGTLGAGYFTYHYGVWAGLMGALVFGVVGGALHALATVVFAVDHIVSGVAINIIALGVSGFLAEAFFTGLPGGGPTQSPSLPSPPTITLPGISDWALELQSEHWFIISDIASVVAALTTRLSVVTILALFLVALSGFVLWRTSFGLRLRSCGESPAAAETLGVNVYLYKVIAVLISGGLAGLAGAYLVLVSSSGFQTGQTGGRGYIGLAAMIFGNWRPGGLLTGSALFGYTQAVQLRSGGESLHALLLLAAVGLLALVVVQYRRGRRRSAAFSLLLAAAMLLWFSTTDVVPAEFTTMAPYVVTLLVLAMASQNLRMPAADGLRYRRGQAG